MDSAQMEALLTAVREGKTEVAEALERLRNLPFEDMGFAKLDHHRALRTGMPEVIFASGKTDAQVAKIFARMAAAGGNVLATRASRACFEAVTEAEPRAEYHETARCITLAQASAIVGKGTVAVVCAGTSDLPVAEEAAVTARLMGNTVELIADVGVAGIHRLLAQRESLQSARVLIVCAGMEGALPTVVGGLVNAPVIAVPTSVGYGASFGGVAALLGMLNTCSPNVCVVNIDNGFGAASIATLINRL
ncbi:nickel pincer cofactor biosynthesis protein LarB [Terracidiphilus gabretensis]|uniref:nickel pincer cofactor biosynthesis protein LarB n=1 Tax=Terracidiphilus gabretensis TaxID=1577687 RepID=UPI00071BC2B8|nr:nickel pincer cofactor biosynthesis protein LarB [Terracidiphilus gabretensis]